MLPSEFNKFDKRNRRDIAEKYNIGEASIYYPISKEQATKLPFSKRFLVYVCRERVIGYGVAADVSRENRKTLIEESDTIYYVTQNNGEIRKPKVEARQEIVFITEEMKRKNTERMSKIYNEYMNKKIPSIDIFCNKKIDNISSIIKDWVFEIVDKNGSAYTVTEKIDKMKTKIRDLIILKQHCKEGKIANEEIESYKDMNEKSKSFFRANEINPQEFFGGAI